MLWKKIRLSFQVHKVVHCNRYRLVYLEIERMDKRCHFFVISTLALVILSDSMQFEQTIQGKSKATEERSQ